MNENLICHHTICDWDDTLCPSSYLECKQAEGKPLDDKDRDQLQKFEEVVCLFLLKALEKDGVHHYKCLVLVGGALLQVLSPIGSPNTQRHTDHFGSRRPLRKLSEL